jgi:polysaccharide export outer membrane protein
MIFRQIVLSICFLLIVIRADPGCMAQSSQSEPTAQGVPLSPGDSIRVTIFDIPELSLDRVQIGGDGTVKLPLIGNVHVAGMSDSDAAHAIDQAYKQGKYVLHPQSSVVLLNFALNGVSITGEVAKPGNYPVTGSRTLVDIIAIAGGLTPLADTRVTIQHVGGGLEENIFLPTDDGRMTLHNNVKVGPGDRVVVPRAGTVYVLGDVTRPGGYLMQHDGKITVLEAIAQASGTARTAGENSAVLIRRNGDSFTTEHLPLRDMYKGKYHDVVLMAGDVVYVPTSIARNFVVNAPEILGTLAGAAIYSVNR